MNFMCHVLAGVLAGALAEYLLMFNCVIIDSLYLTILYWHPGQRCLVSIIIVILCVVQQG